VLTSPVTWVTLLLAVVSAAVLYAVRAVRPGVLREHRREYAEHPAWVWGLAAVLLLLAPGFGTLFAALFAQGLSPTSPRAQAITGLGGYAVAIGVGVMLARLIHKGVPGAGFRVRPKDLAVGAACMALCAPFVQLASIVAGLAYETLTGTTIDDPVAHSTLRMILDNRTDPWAWTMVALAVLAAPIQEELLYRGFLQTLVLNITRGRAWAAIVITSAIFALMHRATGMPWYAIATLFMLSLCMGYAFERSRSIGVPIAMHIAFNAANVVVAMMIA